MIPNDFIQTLLSRVDIVDVIERFVPLKRKGANLSACCPFHQEKTPSFTVSPSKQFYHCFGCGAHGSAIGFLMEHTGRSFVEAVEELARQVGLTVPRVEARAAPAGQQEESAHLLEVLEAASRFYKAQLKAAPNAIDYLKGRGLTGEVAARFRIGYAPPGWQNLAAAFPDYADAALERAGLVIVGDAGRRYDRFRDRIMFPILDSRGQTIGFGGRVLDAGEPKYLNSPETPLFSKGRELYGLFQARTAIRTAGRVFVVEGYMDVVALAQHGVENVVATLGTATTPQHVQKLFRQANRIVFCFDGDEAGRRAAWRALENAIGLVTDERGAAFLFLPEGEDPDSYVRSHGREAFERLADAAVPMSDFLLREMLGRHGSGSPEARAALLSAVKPYLEQLQAPVLRALLGKELARVAGLSEAELAALLPGTPRPSGPAPAGTRRASVGGRLPGGPAAPGPRATRSAPSLHRKLLRGLVSRPDLAATVPEDIALEDSAGPDAAPLRETLALLRSGSGWTTGSLVEHQRQGPYGELVSRLAREVLSLGEEHDWEDEVRGAVGKLREAAASAHLQQLSSAGLGGLGEEGRQAFRAFRQGADSLAKPRDGPK